MIIAFRKVLLASALATITISVDAQIPQRVEPFHITDVRLMDGIFKHAQDMDICYLMALNPDRLLAPYLKEAGLTPKAENYSNWENTGLDGHIGGHYLSALSYMYASTGNREIKSRLDYMLSELKRCQDANGNGYLSGIPNGHRIWKEISRGDIKASGFGLNGGWVPLYNIHKIFAGLRDAYTIAQSNEAKEMLVKLTDWMMNSVSSLSDEQIQDMLRSEHGGLNEVFADVADITGDKRYLTLAHRFSHQLVLEPLLNHQDKLTGMHANTQIPKVIGFKRIADLEGNKQWSGAADFFWNEVVGHRSISIGGNSVCEHFHPSTDFSTMLSSEQGPETCNTYNMLRLSKLLYQSSADTKYMDYYERALYNHILSTQDPVQGGFVYFTPMRSGHYRVYSQPQTSFWCCVGSGMENHARYGEMIYGHDSNNLYVNLFIPSTLRWNDVEVIQHTDFPNKPNTTITINPKKGGADFSLLFRVPSWTNKDEIGITVNGKAQKAIVENGYAKVSRNWKKGDVVTLNLPMHLSAEKLADGSSNYSFLYGPIVLAAQIGKEGQDGLFADDSRGGHIANGPRLALQNMPVIVEDKDNLLSHITKADDSSLKFTLSGVYPQTFENMTLVPFYSLYECRYMVYWPSLTKDEVQTREKEIIQKENERMALDAVTADKVVCGEQQPESDHFIFMEKSVTGNDQGVHWRQTSGWFGYTMKSGAKKITKVRLMMRKEDKRDASLLINGRKIGEFTAKDGVATVDIPTDMVIGESLEVKIEKNRTEFTPAIYEIRILISN